MDSVYDELRCGVCRRRDWERGGPGRADLVGLVYDGRFELEPDVRPVLRGEDQTAVAHGHVDEGGRVNVLEFDPELVDELTGGERWRFRCRRGHRLRYDPDDVRRQLARGDGVAYLPAA